MTRSRPLGPRIGRPTAWGLFAAAMLGGAVSHAQPSDRPTRGETAPSVTLDNLDGEPIATAELEDRIVVLLFGELYHEKTLKACEDVRRALTSDQLENLPIAPMVIVAQDVTTGTLRSRAAEAGVTWPVLHDTTRRSFGDYRVNVMPTVVVLDTEHRLVHTQAGYGPRFEAVITNALLAASGRMDAEAFERSLLVQPEEAPSADHVRAERLTNLARQLAQRGMPDLAEQKYLEAIELAPEQREARIGLGMLRLRRGLIAEAELDFRSVLASSPGSIDGRLGLAYLQALRGGDELAEADRLARGVLADSPDNPSAHYVLGLIHENRDEMDLAAASFKAASEALMSRHGINPHVGGGQEE